VLTGQVLANRPHRAGFKPSRYNVFSERTDYVWAFNARSNALIKLTHDEFRVVRGILDEDQVETDADEENFHKLLIAGQFLIPHDLDELALLKTKNSLVRFGARGVGLVIAPTLRCNFACDYCYVDLNANKMTPEARERTKRFFDYKLNDAASATVTWTGGDPSLALDVVAELSEHFIVACDNHRAQYAAMMITNGYLLDAQMVRRVRECRIETLQITIDGNRAAHNSRRSLAGGKPTYDRILDNIAAACGDVRIAIRMNIDRQNVDTVEDVFCDLRSRGVARQVSVYFACVDAVNEHCKSYANHCFSVREFATIQPKLSSVARTYGIQVVSEISLLRNEYCGANSTNYFVIDSKAKLLRCYNDLGTADVNGIGYIGSDGREVIDKPANLLRWLSWDPFSIEECRDCKVLPMCMGGCSYKRVRHGEGAELGCITIKFALDEFLEMYGSTLAEGRAGCAACSCA
jgi:uncharacterized protein